MENKTGFIETCASYKCPHPVRARGYCKKHYRIKIFLPNHPLYTIWAGMISRCENPRNPKFKSYGGLGIKVCRRWRGSYHAFAADVGLRPSQRHSLERINTDGDFAPGNTQWASPTQQSFNRRKKSTNTSGVTGVYYHKKHERWHATITINKKRHHLGWFIHKPDAVLARAEAEARMGYGGSN